MIDLHLSAFAPRWRFLYAVRIDAYICKTSDVVLLFYTTSEVYTKFGMVLLNLCWAEGVSSSAPVVSQP